jgi:hypothetical protein
MRRGLVRTAAGHAVRRSADGVRERRAEKALADSDHSDEIRQSRISQSKRYLGPRRTGLEMHSFICLSNITVDPVNAAARVSYLPELFLLFQSSMRAWAQRALARVLLAEEAREVMVK